MQLPRVRLTVRRMFALIAALAVGLFLVREFGNGVPPRSVVDGIPARMTRLRPGMSHGQTAAILGLGRSWLRGGTSARRGHGISGLRRGEEYYLLGRAQLVPEKPASLQTRSFVWESSAMIHIRFAYDLGANNGRDWRLHPSTRLESVEFLRDGRAVARMPGSR